VCAYAYHMIPRRHRTSRLFVQNSPIILVYNGPPLLSLPCRPSAQHPCPVRRICSIIAVRTEQLVVVHKRASADVTLTYPGSFCRTMSPFLPVCLPCPIRQSRPSLRRSLAEIDAHRYASLHN
jgi:hypothetical protein